MSVLINGMEMPHGCEHCELCYDFMCCSVTGTHVDYPTMNTQRLGDCPLVAVPEPHGRLIDVGKLKETLDYYISEAGWSDEINKALSWVKDEFIDSEQTVIPASEEAE